MNKYLTKRNRIKKYGGNLLPLQLLLIFISFSIVFSILFKKESTKAEAIKTENKKYINDANKKAETIKAENKERNEEAYGKKTGNVFLGKLTRIPKLKLYVWKDNYKNKNNGKKVNIDNINFNKTTLSNLLKNNYDTYNNDYNILNKKYNKQNSVLIDDNNLSDIMTHINNLYQSEFKTENIFKKEEYIYTHVHTDKFYTKKIIFEDDSQVAIIGDIHSSLHSFIEIILKLIDNGYMNEEFKINDKKYIIFLGDLVDRGQYSFEILYILFKIKLINKNNKDGNRLIILNGNHENYETYTYYGMYGDISNKISEKEVHKLDKNLELLIINTLNFLPSALFGKFESDNKWFQFCHGGIDRAYGFKDDDDQLINFLKDSKKNIDYLGKYDQQTINNKISEDKLIEDIKGYGFLWSDFDCRVEKDNLLFNSVNKGGRGTGYVSGIQSTKKYLDKNNLYAVISGHQDNISLGFIPREIPLAIFKKSITYPGLYELKNELTTYNQETPIEISDFYALVTSSATASKKLENNIFLELSFKEK